MKQVIVNNNQILQVTHEQLGFLFSISIVKTKKDFDIEIYEHLNDEIIYRNNVPHEYQ